MNPFCKTCHDTRTVMSTVRANWKDEHYRAIPCPDCSVPINLIPARILGAFGRAFVVTD